MPRSYPKKPLANDDTVVDDRTLLEAMGFDTAESLDYSDYEGATHVIDLNQSTIPETLHGRFDVLLDSGTIEHVFHIPNVLANIYSLVKVGGRVIFIAPSSNHMDHGFYMFSPTFFYDYYRANGFTIETICVVRYHPDGGRWHVYDYAPAVWGRFQIGGLDGRPYAVFMIATKTAQSRFDVIPQQGFYSDTSRQYDGSRLAQRQEKGPAASPSAIESKPAPSALIASARPLWQQRVRAILRRVPGVRRLSRISGHLVFRLGINLPFGRRLYPRLRGRY